MWVWLWLASQLTRFSDYLSTLPAGFAVTFLLGFAVAALVGKLVGKLVSKSVNKTANAKASSAVVHRNTRSRQRNTKKTDGKSSSMSSSDAPPAEGQRRPGVASPEELAIFVREAGDRLLVIDTRNPDAAVEPPDQATFALGPLPATGTAAPRPAARHLQWDRPTGTMPLPDDSVPKDTPIITHCGGGGRGQMAKEFLERHGFTRVINGGGPKVPECWAVYGDK